jgi:hypothetical protein
LRDREFRSIDSVHQRRVIIRKTASGAPGLNREGRSGFVVSHV